jgi:hypothetical protein
MNTDSNEILIMTATINVGNTPHVQIRDDQERLFQYLCSLVAWIKLTKIKTIVFCENSSTSYDFSEICKFAEDNGKKLEILILDANQKSFRQGKGYGEGKILEYAINNSQYLKNETNFYKITGRLFVSGFDEVQETHATLQNVFKAPAWIEERENIKDPNPARLMLRLLKRRIITLQTRGWQNFNQPKNNVFTVFYKSNVEFFRERLMHSYKRVNDKYGYCLEHAYHDDLRGCFKTFSTEFKIVGRSGTHGQLIDGLDYPSEIKEQVRQLINLNQSVKSAY